MVSLMVTSLGLVRAALHVRIQCNINLARIHSCYTTFVADQNNYCDALHKDVQNCSLGLIYCRNLRKKVGYTVTVHSVGQEDLEHGTSYILVAGQSATPPVWCNVIGC